MRLIFSAVMSGMVTGQTVTSQFMVKSLGKRCRLIVNKQPEKGMLFPIKFFIYIILTFFRFLLFRPDVSYLVLNRTRISFYLRDIWVLILSAFFARKLVVHVVGNDFDRYWINIGSFGQRIYGWVLMNKVEFVVLGEKMELGLRSVFSKIHCQPTYIRLPAFVDDCELENSSKAMLKNKNKNNKITIGYMSNLIPEKGIFEFCQAVKELYYSGASCDVWVAGRRISGVDYATLDALMVDDGLLYHEFISGDLKWDVLSSTDIFVLPTYYSSEYLPLSIIDAMVAGCVIVSCDTGDIAEYVVEANGVLIESKSTSALINALKKLIDGDLQNFNRTSIRDHVIEKLDVFLTDALDEILCH